MGVVGGVIVALFTGEVNAQARETIDVDGLTLLPGGIDPHVHIRDPGSTHRETFYTGTCAAAAGGNTSIIEHPISTPPQYSPEILARRVESFECQGVVDCAFLGAAGGEYPEEIERVGAAGVVGFKTFLHQAPEGREVEFRGLCSRNSYELMETLRRIQKTGLPAATHTEDNDLVAGLIAHLRRKGKTFPAAHCLSRPPVAETLAVEKLLSLARETGARVYLVHVSVPRSVELANAARADGLEVYVETCPQYLYMDESYLGKYGAFAKCNPALHDPTLVEQMWGYVRDGSIDVIASDHAPYTLAEKENAPDDIFMAPAGFPGLETRVPFMMRAVNEGRISLQKPYSAQR